LIALETEEDCTMKKNAVGRILYQKVPAKSRLASWHIPARIVCLLLALLVWLTVTAFSTNAIG
jgi:hypothetical protein